MGMHIVLYNPIGQHVSGWDTLREHHDKDFSRLIDWDNIERAPNDILDEDYFRPRDIQSIRDILHHKQWDNQSRYDQLLDFLEDGCWLYFSY